MTDYIKLDADYIKAQIDALKALYPELEEDDALRADMIEGETEIDKVIARALDHMAEADMMVSAIADRCGQQKARSDRYERRSNAMRTLIKDLMETANLKSIALPEATVSLSNGRQSVVIEDAAQLPQGFVKYEPKPDKKAVGDALKAGEVVPGASLVVGETSLTVRRK